MLFRFRVYNKLVSGNLYTLNAVRQIDFGKGRKKAAASFCYGLRLAFRFSSDCL